MTDSATALVYVEPGHAELRQVALPDLGPRMVEVRTLYSGISRGTERLVFKGRVPEREYERMRAPFQQGDFPFPVRYGYALVGEVVRGPEELQGRPVFVLHPHQDRLRVPVEAAVPLPPEVPPARAVLGANAETALNAVWDAEASPGARVLVVGCGLLGALVAMFLSSIESLAVTVTDILGGRAAVFTDFPVTFLAPDAIGSDYDVVIHTSATTAGLATALNALAFEGVCLELSWFGDRAVPVPLGGAFHARRLTLRSSQVGHVAPARRADTTRRQRLEQALARLADPRLDRLVTGEVAFAELAAAMPRLLAARAPGIATRIRY